MNPNKKAEELIEKFGDLSVDVVDEIINTNALIDEDVYLETPLYLEYWQQVKELIINKK